MALLARPKVRVGRLLLEESEARNIEETPLMNYGRQFNLSGCETLAGHSYAYLRRIVADINNMYQQMVAVVFTVRTDWNGYYRVAACQATLAEWKRDGGATVQWSFNLERIGSANEIDLESRLSGSPTMTNDFSATGERWHAPPPGHTAYWSGVSAPGIVTRTGDEGPIKVYRNIGALVNPRWQCDPAFYHFGRCRFKDENKFERSGVSFMTGTSDWEISNSLVKVVKSNLNTFRVSWHDGNIWEEKDFYLYLGAGSINNPITVSCIVNTFEAVTIRMMYDVAPVGRMTADLTIRRGSRTVELFSRTMLADTLGLSVAAPELGVRTLGRLAASANDAFGNKYLLGSSRTFAWNLASGYIAQSGQTQFDFMVSSIINGTSAQAGDQEIDLYNQYLGSPAETVYGVRR